MKKISFILSLIIVSVCIYAQVPQGFSYQAIARDGDGNVLANHTLSIRISILGDNPESTPVYTEIHDLVSNGYGLVDFVVGEGQIVYGVFEDINWAGAQHSIKVEMDPEGGTEFKVADASQLYAVPYALYAGKAGSLSGPPSQSYGGERSGSGDEDGGGEWVKNTGGDRSVGANSKFPADTSSYMNVNAGKAGVGTTNPQEKLEVAGKVRASEGFKINGSEGLNTGLKVITDIDFNSDTLQEKGLMTNGGILTGLCGDSITDPRDNKKYPTVLIGIQCWFARNLNVGSMINASINQSDDATFEKYCYDNNEANCDDYGGLYQWGETMQYSMEEGTQGICPDGWHVPTDDEYKTLEGFVDSQFPVGDAEWDKTGKRGFDAGKNLESTTAWGDNGTDLYGFNLLPAGEFYFSGFYNLTTTAHQWTSSNNTTSEAWERLVYIAFDTSTRNDYPKLTGLSVRCLRD